MNYLWKIVRPLTGVAGFLLMLGAVGTSDYYNLELRQPEPSGVWTTLWIGALLMLPSIIHIIREHVKG